LLSSSLSVSPGEISPQQSINNLFLCGSLSSCQQARCSPLVSPKKVGEHTSVFMVDSTCQKYLAVLPPIFEELSVGGKGVHCKKVINYPFVQPCRKIVRHSTGGWLLHVTEDLTTTLFVL